MLNLTVEFFLPLNLIKVEACRQPRLVSLIVETQFEMRLIDTKMLKLVEVFEHDAEPYAILSHTWGAEEVSFQEMQGGAPDVNKQG